MASFLRQGLPLLLAWIDRGVSENVPWSGKAGCVKPAATGTTTVGDEFSYTGGGGGGAMRDDGYERTQGWRFDEENAAAAVGLEAASRVQVAAAGAVAGEVYECLGGLFFLYLVCVFFLLVGARNYYGGWFSCQQHVKI